MPLPSDIANLALWFRAYDLVNLADGATVTSWPSVVGTCTASEATNPPTKRTVNGKTCVRFDGANDRLVLDGDALTVSQNVAGLTIFARCVLNDPAPGTEVILGFSIGTATTVRLTLRRQSGLWQAGGRILDAGGFGSTGTASADTLGPHTVTGVFDCTNADLFLFVDGVAAGSNLAYGTAGNTSNTPSQTARFGTQSDDSSWGDMDLYEVIIYQRALTTTERRDVEAYLAPPSAWRAEARCNIRVI